MLDGLVGHIVSRVSCGLVVLVGIDAEHREVARVTRPHPVVGVAAELTDRGRGSTHQTHVREDLNHKCKVLITTEERLHRQLHIGILLLELLHQLRAVLAGDFVVLLLTCGRGYVAHHLSRNVDDLTHETHLQTGCGDLLLARHRPETILQVVVLDATQRLNRAVAAVVVGQQQTLARHDLACAAVAEDDDCVLQRVVVNRIDILGRELQTLGFHILDVHLLEVGQQPHTLVGVCGHGHRRRQHDRNDQIFEFHSFDYF